MTQEQLARIPIIKLWDYLLVPMQGDITDQQAASLTNDVLHQIQQSGSTGLVIDLSGMWMVDSHLCAVLTHLASAARLMGVRTVLSGLSPEIALTLQAMDVTLEGLRTALTLEHALTMLNRGTSRSTAKGIASQVGSRRILDDMLQHSRAVDREKSNEPRQ